MVMETLNSQIKSNQISRTPGDERVETGKEAPWKTSRTARKCMVYWDETERLVRKFRPSVPAGHQVMKEWKRAKRPLENIEDCQKMHGLLGRNFTVSEKISTCPSRTPSDERVETVKEAPWKTSRTARKCMVYRDETSRLVRNFELVSQPDTK